MSPTIGMQGPRIAVVGVHVLSDGYPNVRFKVQGIRDHYRQGYREINFPFRVPVPRARRTGPRKYMVLAAALIRIVAAHIYVLAATIARCRLECVYMPYPAVGLLFAFSLLPRALRPKRIVADAFISVYDTVTGDRQLLAPGSLVSRLLRRVESRAYRVADCIIVDTEASADYFSMTLGVPRGRLRAIPLSIDESAYQPIASASTDGRTRVLFVGTFVPLQGVETITRAAILLRDRPNIEFVLIGDGQRSPLVEALLKETPCPNLTWIRGWQDPHSIAGHIADASICLGIFGTSDKAGRVWPLKNYAYLAVGRPVITGDTNCARVLANRSEESPFALVKPGDPAALASEIEALAREPERRQRLGRAGRRFYEHFLASQVGVTRLTDTLEQLCAALAPGPAQNSDRL
jgi:glycosyltransferase involved in cell wall biosynthesis